MALGWLIDAYSSHYIQARKANGIDYGYNGGQLWAQRALVLGNKGVDFRKLRDGSTIELGGIMEVAMLGFNLVWV